MHYAYTVILWLKAFHIVFVITWFAGLFYLPRLFVYHADAVDGASIDRFQVMERRLLALMTLGATLAIGFGLAMVVVAPGYLRTDWLRMKLALVIALVIYHLWCRTLVHAFAGPANHLQPPRSARWFRWFNEIPGILLIAIVLLAVIKPGGTH